MVRSILDIGDRFAGTVERWGGDVLPPLLTTSATAEEIREAIEERQTLVDRVKAEMDGELGRFFRLLSSSTSSTAGALQRSRRR